jgi:hypothetical protein
MLLLCLLLVTGCSGVNATGTVSPLMFLVPGLGQVDPANNPTNPTPETVASPATPAQVFAQSN